MWNVSASKARSTSVLRPSWRFPVLQSGVFIPDSTKAFVKRGSLKRANFLFHFLWKTTNAGCIVKHTQRKAEFGKGFAIEKSHWKTPEGQCTSVLNISSGCTMWPLFCFFRSKLVQDSSLTRMRLKFPPPWFQTTSRGSENIVLTKKSEIRAGKESKRKMWTHFFWRIFPPGWSCRSTSQDR